MLEHYKGIYRDQRGDEDIVIRNDGTHLFMTLRGVEFAGNHIMSMMPVDVTERPALASFTLHRRTYAVHLCDCAIDYEVPLPVVRQQQIVMGLLTVSVNLGVPAGRGMLDREDLKLSLQVDGEVYRGSGKSGWFEDELLEIQRLLPEGMFIKTCINCAFSDYSVFGHGTFGDMICYRDKKARYLAVKSKSEYIGLGNVTSESVQETYLCPEFERRVPGTGYRG